MTWARVTSLYFDFEERGIQRACVNQVRAQSLEKSQTFSPQRSRQDVNGQNSSMIDQFS